MDVVVWDGVIDSDAGCGGFAVAFGERSGAVEGVCSGCGEYWSAGVGTGEERDLGRYDREE